MLVSDIESGFTFEDFYDFIIYNKTYGTITSETLKYSLVNSLLWHNRIT